MIPIYSSRRKLGPAGMDFKDSKAGAMPYHLKGAYISFGMDPELSERKGR